MVNVLYVDDEKLNLFLLKQSLSDQFNVITAESGFEALNILGQTEINVVISDMRMPKMNGVTFIKKAKINYPDIAYFILTGYDVDDEISEALQQKLIAKSFRKPFQIPEIVTAVREALKSTN
jgi:DNA-binding NtrC family response regulator